MPGDILSIRLGLEIPVDVRFVADAKFVRSILIGESLPLQGTIDSTDSNHLEIQVYRTAKNTEFQVLASVLSSLLVILQCSARSRN
ncbi:hypothetical protein BJ875DRAFT_190869 [Amylocarpus encephaloides]|uniref:Uncharacterized protein n=1 Tax=Amylocarpus encephaloides TaxID=45428 RepID=A0A9P8C7N4_9HELO|nr:hypothetical protein BJ875DRAFT_190869 [Amylocarpus encephaloides]